MVITTSLVAFLTGGSVVASVILSSLKKLWSSVSDRYGSLATQLGLLVVCVAVSGIAWIFQFLPMNIVVASGSIFAGSMLLYEVVYKALFQQAIMGKTN